MFRANEIVIVAAMSLLFAAGASMCIADETPAVPDHSPRVNAKVKLVRQCLPAVVAIRSYRPGSKEGEVNINHGGGSVIHPAGYILTNAHVVKDAARGEALLFGGKWQPLTVVAVFMHEDLAIVKIDADKPLPTLPLGRSHDLMLGEPVLAIGSAGGLPHTVSSGMVSGLARATNTEHTFLPEMVQTTAAVSGGSSGGPLINALGEQIGIITSRKSDAENVGFGITVDRIRRVLPQLIAAEDRFAISFGAAIDPLGPPARVIDVRAHSPAAKAGLAAGDVLTHVGDHPIRHAADLQLELAGRNAGDVMSVRWQRGEEPQSAEVTLQKHSLLPATPGKELTPGLAYSLYRGQWEKLPDFASLTPAARGAASLPGALVIEKIEDHFALQFSGYLKIPKEGLYTLLVKSDDGSRLWIGERLLVENDGLHPARESAGLIRLQAGTYPLRIEYFEASGDQELQVLLAGPGMPKQVIPADWYFFRKETPAPR